MEHIQKPTELIRVGVIPAEEKDIWYTEVSRFYQPTEGKKGIRDLLGGGYMEVVRPLGFQRLNNATGRRHVLIVDEDGHSKGLPLNPRATLIYSTRGYRTLEHGAVIVGDAIICTEAMILTEGEDFYEPDIWGLPDDFELTSDMIG